MRVELNIDDQRDGGVGLIDGCADRDRNGRVLGNGRGNSSELLEGTCEERR